MELLLSPELGVLGDQAFVAQVRGRLLDQLFDEGDDDAAYQLTVTGVG